MKFAARRSANLQIWSPIPASTQVLSHFLVKLAANRSKEKSTCAVTTIFTIKSNKNYHNWFFLEKNIFYSLAPTITKIPTPARSYCPLATDYVSQSVKSEEEMDEESLGGATEKEDSNDSSKQPLNLKMNTWFLFNLCILFFG